MRRLAALALPAILFAAPAASAQRPAPRRPAPPPHALVLVEVTDTARTPLPDAMLVLLDSAGNAQLVARTNQYGRYAFGVDGGLHRLVARKVGYLQTTRALRAAPGDTVNVTMALATVPQVLDTVRVEARRRSDDYHIDAAMIAQVKHHWVADAYDAMRDINQGMLGDGARECRPAMNVWVDGVPVRYSPNAAYDLPVSESFVSPGELFGYPGASLGAVENHRNHARVDDILKLIRAEDIGDISYTNCWTDSIPGNGTRNAIFIRLKPGIVFDDKRGTMPADSLGGGR